MIYSAYLLACEIRIMAAADIREKFKLEDIVCIEPFDDVQDAVWFDDYRYDTKGFFCCLDFFTKLLL